MIGQGAHLDDEFAFVTSLHREDLVAAGLPEKLQYKVSDDLLLEIADKLQDALMDCGYWDCLTAVIDCMNLKNKLSETEEE